MEEVRGKKEDVKQERKPKTKKAGFRSESGLFLYICSEKNVEHGGNLCTACWVQKALDFRRLQALLYPFFASRAGVEEWAFL